jgi:hypothetical protein
VVPTAVSEASLIADEDLAGAESVAVGAAAGRVGDPLPGRSLHQLAKHNWDSKPGRAEVEFWNACGH